MKIKQGDKVVCIKEHIHYRTNGTSIPLTHKIGNFYDVKAYDPSDETLYISAEEYYSDDEHGLWFNLKSSANNDRDYFYNYFITLAEWRDRQIDSIFEDKFEKYEDR